MQALRSNTRSRHRGAVIVAAAVFACGLAAASDAPTHQAAAKQDAVAAPIADLDSIVTRAMDAFAVPGVAVGIVKDGRVVLSKGYGVRELGESGAVDASTIFAIGSDTKAFTTAALAMLVDEGRIHWDDKVIDHLPQFQLQDPYVTREFTIRDLLTHRSGIAPSAGDLMVFPDTDFKRAEIMRGLRYLRPVSSFRSRFAYNNVLYMVAGEIIPAVTGSSWEDFVQRRIIDRLGMTGCTAANTTSAGADNVAAAHAVVDGKLRRVAPVDVTVIAAAGGIRCNVSGMVKWMSLLLGGGDSADDALLSVKQRRELWTPQTPGPVSPLLTKLHGTHFRAYGLGWNLEDFHGHQRVFHSGGLLGMVAHVTLIPEIGLGVVVLANQQAGEAVNAITLHVAKAYLGIGQQDWVAMFKANAAEERARIVAAEAQTRDTLAKAGRPPLPASAYVGTYRDAWRGDATIRKEGDALVLTFSRTQRLSGTLAHYGDGMFIVQWQDRSLNAAALVRFTQDFAGHVEGMTLQGLPTSESSLDFPDLDFHKLDGDAAGR
jgi:CubicO group peptidase (beta-lactamase class C family)